ncbi:MAG: DNA-directed RNA polymerase subunit omega [Planctomycetota bacterium]
MIEALKDDTVIHALGGRFKFTSLVQHRVRELMDGARPLVERRGPDNKMRSDFEVAVAEIVEGKITWGIEGQEPEPVPRGARCRRGGRACRRRSVGLIFATPYRHA